MLITFQIRLFLPFWASINNLTRTPSFHITVSSSMPFSCPQPIGYGCCCCYSKSLEHGFIVATRGATMMIVEIDSPTFPLITFTVRGKSWKMKGIPEGVLASAIKIQANFLLFTKIFHVQEMLVCYTAVFRVVTQCSSPQVWEERCVTTRKTAV